MLSAVGRFPNVMVDAAGTSHIVWVETPDKSADVIHYCRLKRAATTCDNPAASRTLTPQKEYGEGDDPAFNVSTDGARILQVGQEIVILDYRYPTVYLKPDGSDQSQAPCSNGSARTAGTASPARRWPATSRSAAVSSSSAPTRIRRS